MNTKEEEVVEEYLGIGRIAAVEKELAIAKIDLKHMKNVLWSAQRDNLKLIHHIILITDQLKTFGVEIAPPFKENPTGVGYIVI